MYQRRFASDEPLSKAAEEVKADVEQASETAADKTSEIKETAADKTEEARSTVAETAQNASETIRETAAATAEAVQGATRSAASMLMGRSADKAQSGTFGEPKPSKILYVGNLFFEVRAEELEREFSRFGEVVNCRIAQDPKGLSKGYVTF